MMDFESPKRKQPEAPQLINKLIVQLAAQGYDNASVMTQLHQVLHSASLGHEEKHKCQGATITTHTDHCYRGRVEQDVCNICKSIIETRIIR